MGKRRTKSGKAAQNSGEDNSASGESAEAPPPTIDTEEPEHTEDATETEIAAVQPEIADEPTETEVEAEPADQHDETEELPEDIQSTDDTGADDESDVTENETPEDETAADDTPEEAGNSETGEHAESDEHAEEAGETEGSDESGDSGESGDSETGDGAENGEDAEDGEEAESPLALSAVVEAVLFAAREPLKLAHIARAVGKRTRQEAVREAMDELNVHYLETGRAFEIAEISGRFQLMSRPEFAPHIMKIYPKRELTPDKEKSQRLTPTALDTLAIIAYKQPVTRAEIEHIRGVGCGPVLKALMERDSIRIAGKRMDMLGQPLVYGTTENFLAEFGLGSLDELPMRNDFLAILGMDIPPVEAAEEQAGEPGASGEQPVATPDAVAELEQSDDEPTETNAEAVTEPEETEEEPREPEESEGEPENADEPAESEGVDSSADVDEVAVFAAGEPVLTDSEGNPITPEDEGEDDLDDDPDSDSDDSEDLAAIMEVTVESGDAEHSADEQ